MDKINVDLYGGKGIFGGRETPLEADIVYCDKYKECSFYKQGKCFSAGRWKQNCKFGQKSTVRGYTSRAIKYNEFKRKYKDDEHYNKLNEPNNKIGQIADMFVLNMDYLKQDEEKNRYYCEVSFWSTNKLNYIPKKDFTNEIIKMICDFKPKTIFDNVEIKSYQEKEVPRFLYELKTQFNDIYTRFIDEYSEYKDKEMNFVGRRAYIYSLKDGVELTSNYSDKTKFIKDGDYLKSIINYNGSFMPFKAEEAEIKLKINRKMSVEIKDNSIVDEDTIFED